MKQQGGGEGAHPRVSAGKGTAGIRHAGKVGRGGDTEKGRRLKGGLIPLFFFLTGEGLQPGSTEEDANVGKMAQGAGAQSGARKVAREAGRPSGKLVEQSRPEVRKWGREGVLERELALPAAGTEAENESEFPACTTGWEVVPSTKRRNTVGVGGGEGSRGNPPATPVSPSRQP